MTLQKFIDENNGKYIDYDGSYGAQCVDLIRYYITEVLDKNAYSIPAVNYAKEMFEKIPEQGNKDYYRIHNQKDNYPIKGDIVVWGWKWLTTGIAGHVAIATGGNKNKFISFDQNYPKGSPCRYYNHDYKGVKGWLRPRDRNNI